MRTRLGTDRLIAILAFMRCELQRVRAKVERRLMHDLRDLLDHAIEKSLGVWLVGSCPRPQRRIDRTLERIAVAGQQLESIAIRAVDSILRAPQAGVLRSRLYSRAWNFNV
jgi:hypothetical protein